MYNKCPWHQNGPDHLGSLPREVSMNLGYSIIFWSFIDLPGEGLARHLIMTCLFLVMSDEMVLEVPLAQFIYPSLKKNQHSLTDVDNYEDIGLYLIYWNLMYPGMVYIKTNI